jgi:hypothetical protein
LLGPKVTEVRRSRTGRADDRESEEEDVAGHVGDEHGPSAK